jgi:SAM-dependent methyltransferase
MDKQQELEQSLIEQLTQSHEYDSIEPTDAAFLLYSPKPIGYNTTNEQRYVFTNLVSGFDGTSITDIGCGRADLYDHLSSTTGVTVYNGIDHNPSMTQLAKQRYNIDCVTSAFENIDIPSASWVVACSVFTQRRCETEDADLIKLFNDVDKLYNAAENVVAFNLLSPIGNEIIDGFFYAHPGLVLDMLIEKYKNVTVRHNYSEFLYTVIIYKF